MYNWAGAQNRASSEVMEDNEEQVIDNFMDELDYYDDEMVSKAEIDRSISHSFRLRNTPLGLPFAEVSGSKII